MKSKIALSALLVFAIAQLIQPKFTDIQEVNQNDFLQQENPPEELRVYIQTNCYDCHSNQPKYPWYSEISPLSWWIQDHIEEGSEHLNFSDWGSYSAKKKAHKMEEAVEEVEEDEMPLPSYTLIHRSAILDEAERENLLAWFKQIELKYASS